MAQKNSESSSTAASVENAMLTLGLPKVAEKNVEKLVPAKQHLQRVSTVVNSIVPIISQPPLSAPVHVPAPVMKQHIVEESPPQSNTKRKSTKESNRNVKSKIDIEIKCGSCSQIFNERRLAEAHFRQKHLGLRVIK